MKIPSYQDWRNYCKSINVGSIEPLHGCTVTETLQKIVSTPALWNKATFLTKEKLLKLETFLKQKNSLLYQQFNSACRTLIIRDTGDNFRGASRYPTEQTSFSILNIPELITCPNGQFISTL